MVKIQCAINGCDGIGLFMVHLLDENIIPNILVCDRHYHGLREHFKTYPDYMKLPPSDDMKKLCEKGK